MDLPVGRDTVRRRLSKRGLNARVAAQKEFLNENHMARRLKFATDYVDKPVEFWDNLVFTDEKTFG